MRTWLRAASSAKWVWWKNICRAVPPSTRCSRPNWSRSTMSASRGWSSAGRPSPLPLCASSRAGSATWTGATASRTAELAQQTSASQIAHQRGAAEAPGRNAVAVVDPVDESAELRCRDGDPVAELVGEALAFGATVFGGCEHGAAIEHDTIRILVHATHHLRHQLGGVAADLAHRAFAAQHEAIVPFDREVDGGRPHVIEGEAPVEQADERPDRGGAVVVLGLTQEKRAPPLEIAQIDVVAERRTHDRAAAVRHQRHFGLGIVPARGGMKADFGTGADRRHRLRLGEDLGVGADADFEVLRPETALYQRLLEALGCFGTGTDAGKVGADLARQRVPHPL